MQQQAAAHQLQMNQMIQALASISQVQGLPEGARVAIQAVVPPEPSLEASDSSLQPPQSYDPASPTKQDRVAAAPYGQDKADSDNKENQFPLDDAFIKAQLS